MPATCCCATRAESRVHRVCGGFLRLTWNCTRMPHVAVSLYTRHDISPARLQTDGRQIAGASLPKRFSCKGLSGPRPGPGAPGVLPAQELPYCHLPIG